LFEGIEINCPTAFVQLKKVSMGMSGDYQIAQEERKTMVRIWLVGFLELGNSKKKILI